MQEPKNWKLRQAARSAIRLDGVMALDLGAFKGQQRRPFKVCRVLDAQPIGPGAPAQKLEWLMNHRGIHCFGSLESAMVAADKEWRLGKNRVRMCRYCHCTEHNACSTPRGPCHWIEDDVCSAPECRRALKGYRISLSHRVTPRGQGRLGKPRKAKRA